MEELMKAKGVDNSFFKSTTELTSSEQVKALCDGKIDAFGYSCLLYTSPSPRDATLSRMPSSA